MASLASESSSLPEAVNQASLKVPATALGPRPGSGGGSAVMEKSKLSIKQEQKAFTPKVDDAGGGGGIGNKIFNGGGGGGDEDDDDDYFDSQGDDEGDDSRWWHKVPLEQLYDGVTVRAVLSEWCMTVESLPGFLRMLASMPYYSTAQWVRYLTMQERPNIFRAVERSLARFPDARSGFVGRMLADPAFLQKMGLEGSFAFVATFLHELHVRGKRIVRELDAALINAVCMGFGAAFAAALVAPSKTPSPPASTFPWQSMLNKLPNNAFEKNTPARSFQRLQRVSGFFAKGVELSAVYAIAGGASAAMQHCVAVARQSKDRADRAVTPVPGISRSAGGMGIYGGLAANTRLQAAAGLDRTLLEYAKVNTTWQVVGLSMLFRGATALTLENPWATGPRQVVACSRASLQGAPTHHVPTPVKRRRRVRKAKRKPALEDMDSPSSSGLPTAPVVTAAV